MEQVAHGNFSPSFEEVVGQLNFLRGTNPPHPCCCSRLKEKGFFCQSTEIVTVFYNPYYSFSKDSLSQLRSNRHLLSTNSVPGRVTAARAIVTKETKC